MLPFAAGARAASATIPSPPSCGVMTHGERREPCPVAAILLQGIVEGTMGTSRGKAPTFPPFEFSDVAQEEIRDALGASAELLIPQLRALIRGHLRADAETFRRGMVIRLHAVLGARSGG